MSQTTLEAPGQAELPESNDAAPAEPRPARGNGVPEDGKEKAEAARHRAAKAARDAKRK